MGESDGEGIGGVGGRGFTKTQDGAHHEGDLGFVGCAFANGGLFDLTGGVVVDGESVFGGGDENGSAHGTEGDGGAIALDEDGGLDGALGGAKFDDELVEFFADGDEAAGGQEFGGILDHAIGDGRDGFAVALEEGVAGIAQGRVDRQDAEGLTLRLGLRHKWTFCRGAS